MTDANKTRLLLDRIAAYLEAEEAAGGKGRTYYPMHPAVLLQEAEDTIEDLAIQAGLWGPPRTVQGTPRAHPTGARRETPSAPAQSRRDEVYDATVQGIAIAMAIEAASPPPAPDPSPTPDFSGGGGDSGGGGASGSFGGDP